MKVCVDTGGTKVAVKLTQGGALLARRGEPTVKTGRRHGLAMQIDRMTHEACAEQVVEVSALRDVGVCSCGPFVLSDRLIELSTPNTYGGMAGHEKGPPNDWNSAPLQGQLKQAFGRALVRIENDEVTAPEAERRWGALQGVSNAASVTWSTCVGVGLCVAGQQVLRGKNRNAWHSFVSTDTQARWGCSNVGDAERLVSGHAPLRRAYQRTVPGLTRRGCRCLGACRRHVQCDGAPAVQLDGQARFATHQPRLQCVLTSTRPAVALTTGRSSSLHAGLDRGLGTAERRLGFASG